MDIVSGGVLTPPTRLDFLNGALNGIISEITT